MPMSQSDVLYGAAYRVVFDRLDPDGCCTTELLSAVLIESARIAEWARTQEPTVASAYLRALPEIETRARDVHENNQRHLALTGAFEAIPKPPQR